MSVRIPTLVLAGVLCASPSGLTAQGTRGTMAADTSDDFIKEAGQGGKAEIELAKLAEDRASRQDVKDLALKIKEDHRKANDDLLAMAAWKRVIVPETPTAAQQATYDRLAKLSGAAFDRAYVDAMVLDHRKDVAEFKKHETDSDEKVAEFAKKTRPVLEDHLSRAETVQRAIRGIRLRDLPVALDKLWRP